MPRIFGISPFIDGAAELCGKSNIIRHDVGIARF
jgi:hypothetical protein